MQKVVGRRGKSLSVEIHLALSFNILSRIGGKSIENGAVSSLGVDPLVVVD